MKRINYLFLEKKGFKVMNIIRYPQVQENIIKILFYSEINILHLKKNLEYYIKNQKNIRLIQREEK